MSFDLDPFCRPVSLPVDCFSREERIALVLEAGTAWLEGRQPSERARLFTAAAIVASIHENGDIARHYWRIVAPRGSHRTPARVARELAGGLIGDERQNGEADENSDPNSSEQ